MILSRRVKMGSVQLDSLDPVIVIQDVQIGTPKETVSKAPLAGGFGQRILTSHWDTMDVEIRFGIDLPKTMIAARRAVWEAVAAWAMPGGWLRTSEVPDRRLWIDQAEIEDPGDFREWNKDFGITFHAFTVPFWQDETPVTATKNIPRNNETTFTLDVPGMVQTVAEFEYTNTSNADLISISIGTDAVDFAMADFRVGPGETIVTSHVNGRLRIYSGTTNLLRYRIGESGDDLYLNPGTNTIRVYADRAGTLVMTAAGRYV